jgi:hypothetical protein
MTYEDSAALMTDAVFRGRVKVGCLKFATYILDEAASVPAHQTRIKWAQQTMTNPEFSTTQVVPPVVMDNQVQTDGAAITDEALQTAVETTVNKLI